MTTPRYGREGFYCRYKGEFSQRHLGGSRLNQAMKEEMGRAREEERQVRKEEEREKREGKWTKRGALDQKAKSKPKAERAHGQNGWFI